MAKNYRDRETKVVLGYNPAFADYPTVEEFDDEAPKEPSDSSQKKPRGRPRKTVVADDDLG